MKHALALSPALHPSLYLSHPSLSLDLSHADCFVLLLLLLLLLLTLVVFVVVVVCEECVRVVFSFG